MIKVSKLLGLLLVFVACQPKERIYIKHKKLSPYVEWLKKDTREFSIPIADSSLTYNLYLTFRYATGYKYKVALVRVKETSPGGKVLLFEYDLRIRDEDGEYIGQPGYDIWDSEHLVEPVKIFKETGTYTYSIEHNMPVDPLNFAMEIGMIVDIAK